MLRYFVDDLIFDILSLVAALSLNYLLHRDEVLKVDNLFYFLVKLVAPLFEIEQPWLHLRKHLAS